MSKERDNRVAALENPSKLMGAAITYYNKIEKELHLKGTLRKHITKAIAQSSKFTENIT